MNLLLFNYRSRLGCQCKVDASYKDEIFIIPSATNNIFTPP